MQATLERGKGWLESPGRLCPLIWVAKPGCSKLKSSGQQIQEVRILEAGLCELPLFGGPLPLLHVPWGLAGIFFGFLAVGLNLLTSLPFFSCSFSPCRRKARSPSGCASGPLGPFCCLFFTAPPPGHVHMICASELWLVHIVCFSWKQFVCMLHACVLLQTSLEHSVRMCVPAWCTFSVACVCLYLYSVLLPQMLITLLLSYFAQCVHFLLVAAAWHLL